MSLPKANENYSIRLSTSTPPHPQGRRLTHRPGAELLDDRTNGDECPAILYRYVGLGVQPDSTDLTERALQMIRDGAFWFSPPASLNDPCEMAFVESASDLPSAGNSGMIPLSREVANNRDKCRVCCFTSEWNNGPMWANYANGQSGICIGFDTLELRTCFFKVNYSPRDLSGFSGQSGLLLAMTTKTQDWEFEKEWRLVYPWSLFVQPANGESVEGLPTDGFALNLFAPIGNDEVITGCHQHLNCRVREIIFGTDVATEDIERIKNIVAAYTGVTLYRARVGGSIEREPLGL